MDKRLTDMTITHLREMSTFKILSWNCHGGLIMDKYLHIIKYSPHILIIEECKKMILTA
jgi:hypothetical protein